MRVVRVRASSGKLNKLDGVSASVNYATEKAAVEYDPAQVTPQALVDAGRAGRATPPACRRPSRRAVEEDPTATICAGGSSFAARALAAGAR